MLKRLLPLFAVSTLFSLNITFLEKPATYQLYPRDDANTGTVKIRGTLNDTGYDTLSVTLTRNNRPYGRTAIPAVYLGDTASFDFQLPIPAELAEYGFRLYADTALALAADSVVAGDAFAISGQSNSITFIVGDVHEYIRTYKGGRWKVSEQGNQYADGPDVGLWGQQIAFHINQEQGIPVFIVNGGVPSMGISYFIPGATGYVDVLNRCTLAGLRDHLKAVFYYQGEADCGAGYGSYAASFSQLYQGWKTDYPALKKAYVCQIGIWNGGMTDVPWARNIRELQRNFPLTCPDVRVMATLGSPEPGGHFGANGYRSIGDKLYRLVARDIYGSGDTAAISPPNLLRAFYSSAGRDRITLLFDQPTYWKDSLGHKLADYFALDSAYRVVDSGWHELPYHRIILKLKAPSTAARITYLTGGNYHPDDTAGVPAGYPPIYNGPYLFNSRRVGALTFHEAPVESPLYSDTSAVAALLLTCPKSELLRFESAQVTAALSYAGGGTDTNRAIAFRSLDPFVAAVDANGLVRGFNPGTCRVMASRDAMSDTVTVTVNPGFVPLAGLEFTAKANTLRTLLAGDSMPIGLAALAIEKGDTLRFFMDTLCAMTVPAPQLEARNNFIYAIQGGDNLLVSAEAAGLRCSTRVTVVPMPSFIRRVNFQAAGAPISAIPGWIMDSGTPYSAGRGLGWVNPSDLSGYSIAGRDPNYFRQTMIRTQQNRVEQVFRIDAPAGKYRIRIRNFNLFFCYETSYVRCGADTLVFNPVCNYSWDFDMQVTRDIEIIGNSGLVLNIYGAVCYLVLVSDDGTDFNLVAKDDPGIIYPPPLITETDRGRPRAALNETPMACPNPFNPSTVVRFGLPAKVAAEYGVYNIRGQCVRHYLLQMEAAPQERMVRVGDLLASGVYYGRLVRSDGKRFIHKLALVR
jgi:hypothetical protein